MEENEEDLLIRIDAYIRKHLSATEAADLERQIAADPALAARVEQQRRHLHALDVLLEDDLLDKMKVWNKEIEEKIKATRFQLWSKWTLAIVGVGALVAIYFWQKQLTMVMPQNQNKEVIQDSFRSKKQEPMTPNPETQNPKPKTQTPSVQKPTKPIADIKSIPADFFASSEAELAVILTELKEESTRRSDKNDTLLLQTYRLIQQRDYAQAISLSKNIQTTEGAYVLAMTYFLKGQYAQALPVFNKLSKNEGFNRAEMADYYTALSFLGNGRKEEAKKQLSKIADDKGHQYTREAKMALQRLGY